MILRRLAVGINKQLRYFLSNSQGLTLIETLVALSILSIVGITFITGLGVSSKSIMVSQKRVNAESLAKSQLEYVKNFTYDADNNPPVYEVDPDLTIPDGYSMLVAAERLDPDNDTLADDDGLQKITITINYDGSTVLALTGYKMN